MSVGLSCTSEKLCRRARKAYIERTGMTYNTKRGYRSVYPWTIRVYSPDGDEDIHRIQFCPFCGTSLKGFGEVPK